MIKQQWKKIGIDADVKETERSLAFTKTANAEHHIMFWTVGGLGEPLPLPAPRPAGGSGGLPPRACRSRAGTPPTASRARSRPIRRCSAPWTCYRSAAGKKEAERIKIAQEIWKIIVRGVLGHRDGRAVAGLHGRADREEQHGQHPGAPDQRAARADAQHVAPGDVLLQVVSGGRAAVRPFDRSAPDVASATTAGPSRMHVMAWLYDNA